MRLVRRAGWSAAAILALAALTGGGAAQAQVSPGPLARAHADVEGMLKCTRCHAGGKEAMRARCVSCHGDIEWLADRRRGYHGAASAQGQPCARCHPDHAGREFGLIQWPDGSADRFDHRRAGWALEQSHSRAQCADCHATANRRSPAAALAVGGKSRWTGLEQACVTCHDDSHRGALGQACTSCHDAGAWKEAPDFSHDTTGYALTGRHQTVACEKCHLDPRLQPKLDAMGRPVPVYRPVPSASCASCHRDVHEGGFGDRCAGCHTTRGFAQITGDGFDHARTKFPLRGRHTAVTCTNCHRDFTTAQGRRPAFATCSACHADAHGGGATVAGKVDDCAACHSERGFTPGTFSVERHRATRYPLEGRHAAVRCAACHRVDPAPDAADRLGPSRVVLRPAFARCADCHADDHGSQLAGRPDSGGCGTCHGVDGFKPSRFGRSEHAVTRLALDGRHAEIPCAACHAANRAGLRPLPDTASRGTVDFAFRVETGCAACHTDPHAGRFEPEGARPIDGGCRACHDATRFAPTTVEIATHSRFAWPLSGAHRAVPCGRCHEELAKPGGVPATSSLIGAGERLRDLPLAAPSQCAECHESTHGSQFDSRPDRGRCDACHGDDGFVPASRFDHDRDAAFALRGSHQRVTCGACHRPADRVVPLRIVYRPVASSCEACHTAR